MKTDQGRVVIVGGGILGTMHAVLARRRGLAVTHLEREPEGRGASVRNFGLIWVSGRRTGAELALALRARELWEEVAVDAPGTGFRPGQRVAVLVPYGCWQEVINVPPERVLPLPDGMTFA